MTTATSATPENRYIMTVLVADRIGIMRDITSAIADIGGNIDAISQTVVEGYFTVILTATVDKSLSAEDVRNAVLENFDKNEASVLIRSYSRLKHCPVIGDRYILTITGEDCPGILKKVTTFLAEKGINIEDWYVEFKGPGVTHIGEITIPRLLDIRQVQDEFDHLLSAMNMVSCIQHENIFIATNQVGAIESLLMENRHAQDE